MELFKQYYPLISTTLFVVVILLAHVFATDPYDWTKNTISDLGAQGYGKKSIMQIGFLVFGLTLSVGVLANGLSLRTTPILIYGLCIALTGIFCTKPFVEMESYSSSQSTLHSVFAQAAGVSFSIGILMQLFFTSENKLKYVHLLFFILVIGLSAAFGLVKNYPGIIQRLLYLTSFFWLIKYYKA